MCPSFPKLVNLYAIGSYNYTGGVGVGYNSSYAYNFTGTARYQTVGGPFHGLGGEWFYPSSTTHFGVAPAKETDIVAASDMIAVGDGWLENVWDPHFGTKIYSDPWLGYAHWIDQSLGPGWALWQKTEQLLHDGRSNIGFCDGHVELIRFQDLYSRADDRLRKWNTDHQPHREGLP